MTVNQQDETAGKTHIYIGNENRYVTEAVMKKQ